MITTARNFCTLLGSESEWYWEDATRPWSSSGRIRHFRKVKASFARCTAECCSL